MKLIELTNILQDLCYSGHSTQEVGVADSSLFEAVDAHRAHKAHIRGIESVSLVGGETVIILSEAGK